MQIQIQPPQKLSKAVDRDSIIEDALNEIYASTQNEKQRKFLLVRYANIILNHAYAEGYSDGHVTGFCKGNMNGLLRGAQKTCIN